jgi:hypothetical protein
MRIEFWTEEARRILKEDKEAINLRDKIDAEFGGIEKFLELIEQQKAEIESEECYFAAQVHSGSMGEDEAKETEQEIQYLKSRLATNLYWQRKAKL